MIFRLCFKYYIGVFNVLLICKAPLNILYELWRYINLYNNNNNNNNNNLAVMELCVLWILLMLKFAFF